MVKKKEVNKNPIKKFWNFMWNGDSLLSWITFLVFVFVVVRFIFFPTLSLITGTSLPLAIVESCSMHHGQKLDSWWVENGGWYEQRGITKEDFATFPVRNGFTKGDIFFILGVKKDKIEVGDVIIFSSGVYNRPIIHRVVSLEPLATKGDNNAVQFTSGNNNERIDETNISEEQLIGRTTFVRVPYAGWIKLIFYEPLRPSSERGFCR